MRNNRKFAWVLMLICVVGLITGCAKESPKSEQLDELEIQSICNLATLECYYHNVAKSNKTAGFLQYDRKFWIEYTGVVRMGVDMEQVKMQISGNQVTLTMPPAKVLSSTIDHKTMDESSYICSGDSWFFIKNKITADDQTTAIKEAQDEMERTASANKSLLSAARKRAKVLIENYICQMSEISGVEYQITWKYADGTPDSVETSNPSSGSSEE